MVETETYRIEVVVTVPRDESEMTLVGSVLDLAQSRGWRVTSARVEPMTADCPAPARGARRLHGTRRERIGRG